METHPPPLQIWPYFHAHSTELNFHLEGQSYIQITQWENVWGEMGGGGGGLQKKF